METINKEAELDWELDAAVIEARKRLHDVESIKEQRERERQLLWDDRTSDDPFLRARYRGEWQRADEAAAQAEQYYLQAKTRLTTAEQQAKAAAQPAWDLKFRESWTDIEQIIKGPLLLAIQRWEAVTTDAGAKGMIVPACLPANLTTDTLPTWVLWVNGQLGIETE